MEDEHRVLVDTQDRLCDVAPGGRHEAHHRALPHGWLGSETLQSRFGDFQFNGGYPAGDTADRLFEIDSSRAIEVYQNQLMRVSEAALDARNNVYYMAAGNSPAMMAKNVGQGSQYLWTYRDADGAFLDGAKSYKLHVPADIPVEAFWSVVVYDALSRSELQTSQPLPSGSGYSDPKINADGTIDVFFGPEKPQAARNWIETVPGKGWFPIFRVYSPKQAYFDKTWRLEDIAVVD